ncbi:LysR family transcriptional regulator [Thiothrix eikelboomii]|uniref:LysR family transcriptional regulator n=1 Tax=Thiothrix eikelboomii TaxID=92487 RepID=UPI003BB20319
MTDLTLLKFFTVLCRQKTLAAAARELDITPSAATKRLIQMETSLGVKLVNRTTRKLSLTAEGEMYFDYASKILAEIEEMDLVVSKWKETPGGLLRVNAPLGFGRTYIASVISEFVKHYQDVEVQLTLTDAPIHFPDDSIDVAIRFGDPPDSRVIAKRLAPCRRLLCAAPAYLEQHGIPNTPQDLSKHKCIVIRQNEETATIWRFTKEDQTESVKVSSSLSTNDGQVALKWALNGHGILMRSEWDLSKYVRSGQLKLVLEDYDTPPANIYAIYQQKATLSAKVALFVNYLSESFLSDSKAQVW